MKDPITPEAFRCAMKDPDHLKRWSVASRPFIVLVARDLVDALPWSHGVEMMQEVLALYAEYRRKIPTGDVERRVDPMMHETIEVPLVKNETLTVDELDRCIRWLVGQLKDRRPEWTLESEPL